MEESAVYLKYSGQGFAHDAITLWVLVKAIVVLPDHLYCMRMVVLGFKPFTCCILFRIAIATLMRGTRRTERSDRTIYSTAT